MTDALTDALPEMPAFPMARATGCPFDPAPELSRLLDDAPVSRVRLWDGSTPWLVTRYADVRAVLADPRISVDVARPGFPHTNAVSKARDGHMKTLMQMDAPEHIAQRRLLTSDFTIRRMEALRPRIQRIVDDLIDEMLAGPNPVDLVEAFALPVPSLVICELLGAPYTARDLFHRVSRTLVMDEPDPEQAMAASEELNAYLEELVEEKNAEPGDDVFSRLAVEQYRTGAMTHQCLGQPLARVELQVVFGTLYRRIPTLAPAVPLEQLTFKENAVFYGVRELPVTW